MNDSGVKPTAEQRSGENNRRAYWSLATNFVAAILVIGVSSVNASTLQEERAEG